MAWYPICNDSDNAVPGEVGSLSMLTTWDQRDAERQDLEQLYKAMHSFCSTSGRDVALAGALALERWSLFLGLPSVVPKARLLRKVAILQCSTASPSLALEVPHGITSNAFLAKSLARVLIAYMQDLEQHYNLQPCPSAPPSTIASTSSPYPHATLNPPPTDTSAPSFPSQITSPPSIVTTASYAYTTFPCRSHPGSPTHTHSTAQNQATLWVFELGAGHCLLGALLARQLHAELKRRRHDGRSCFLPEGEGREGGRGEGDVKGSVEKGRFDWRVMVVLTDFNKGLLASRLEMPWVRELRAEGVLDVAVLDAGEGGDEVEGLNLLGRRETVEVGSIEGPVVVLGTYALDSFPVDVFVQLREGGDRRQNGHKDFGGESRAGKDQGEALLQLMVERITGSLQLRPVDSVALQSYKYVEVLGRLMAREAGQGLHVVPVGLMRCLERIRGLRRPGCEDDAYGALLAYAPFRLCPVRRNDATPSSNLHPLPSADFLLLTADGVFQYDDLHWLSSSQLPPDSQVGDALSCSQVHADEQHFSNAMRTGSMAGQGTRNLKLQEIPVDVRPREGKSGAEPLGASNATNGASFSNATKFARSVSTLENEGRKVQGRYPLPDMSPCPDAWAMGVDVQAIGVAVQWICEQRPRGVEKEEAMDATADGGNGTDACQWLTIRNTEVESSLTMALYARSPGLRREARNGKGWRDNDGHMRHAKAVGSDAKTLGLTQQAFARYLCLITPCDYEQLQGLLTPSITPRTTSSPASPTLLSHLGLPGLLSLLRWSAYDAELFFTVQWPLFRTFHVHTRHLSHPSLSRPLSSPLSHHACAQQQQSRQPSPSSSRSVAVLQRQIVNIGVRCLCNRVTLSMSPWYYMRYRGFQWLYRLEAYADVVAFWAREAGLYSGNALCATIPGTAGVLLQHLSDLGRDSASCFWQPQRLFGSAAEGYVVGRCTDALGARDLAVLCYRRACLDSQQGEQRMLRRLEAQLMAWEAYQKE